MTKVVRNTEVDRVVIMKAENGGGKPKVGAHIYVSAVMEVHKDPTISIVDNYQRLRTDSSYIDLLATLISKGCVKYSVSELNNSLLKTIYSAENICYSEIYYLYATDEAIFYCSFATSKPDTKFEASSTALAIEIAVNQITDIFKNNL